MDNMMQHIFALGGLEPPYPRAKLFFEGIRSESFGTALDVELRPGKELALAVYVSRLRDHSVKVSQTGQGYTTKFLVEANFVAAKPDEYAPKRVDICHVFATYAPDAKDVEQSLGYYGFPAPALLFLQQAMTRGNLGFYRFAAFRLLA